MYGILDAGMDLYGTDWTQTSALKFKSLHRLGSYFGIPKPFDVNDSINFLTALIKYADKATSDEFDDRIYYEFKVNYAHYLFNDINEMHSNEDLFNPLYYVIPILKILQYNNEKTNKILNNLRNNILNGNMYERIINYNNSLINKHKEIINFLDFTNKISFDRYINEKNKIDPIDLLAKIKKENKLDYNLSNIDPDSTFFVVFRNMRGLPIQNSHPPVEIMNSTDTNKMKIFITLYKTLLESERDKDYELDEKKKLFARIINTLNNVNEIFLNIIKQNSSSKCTLNSNDKTILSDLIPFILGSTNNHNIIESKGEINIKENITISKDDANVIIVRKQDKIKLLFLLKSLDINDIKVLDYEDYDESQKF